MSKPQLPLYQSHKKVRAARILAVDFREDGSATIFSSEGTVATQPAWRQRFPAGPEIWEQNADLGYYVQYEDGYESWSPSQAFEAGYTMVEE